jgi:putative membrane-bound dehydrogenase-like protein
MRLTLLLAIFAATSLTGARMTDADELPGSAARVRDGNRLAYLDENNPWYPRRNFPKLITPQWVGDEGVECVVILAIDDMREPAKYEAFLRPILERLKKIDGRAPVSIMTCNVKPDDPQLAQWQAEGLSFEVHTIDHPCPLLQGGEFTKAKATYDRCVDLMNEIPGNKPVAFRMPCCDSLNTLSPRFYAEIFNKTTAKGNFLSISSSVFNLFTPNDPDIPRELVIDSDGREKFRKYIPRGLVREGKTFDTFVNTIEDYPYPYVVNRLCWEFPCVVPSDWSARFLQKPNNPDTIRDLKAALDITVLKQGVYNLVFHPHHWIKPEQIVELIDHAVTKHGKKVKFLMFREALERLNKNLLAGIPLRSGAGGGLTARLVDVNGDGFMDVVYYLPIDAVGEHPATRVWSSHAARWDDKYFRDNAIFRNGRGISTAKSPFGIFGEQCEPAIISYSSFELPWHVFQFTTGQWIEDRKLLPEYQPKTAFQYICRDIDGDGVTEVLRLSRTAKSNAIFQYPATDQKWRQLPFRLPEGVDGLDREGLDPGLRFVDINEDGFDDIVFSNSERFGVYLFKDMQTGWSRVVVEGTRGGAEANGRRSDDKSGGTFDLPPIVRADGTDNGFFVHSRHLFWQNEDTDKLSDLVDRRSFNEILAQAPDLPPKPKSPEASLRCIQPRPGFTVELMAAEPLVLDPIAFAFGADGKLWVVEMGDYPLGVHEREKPDQGGGQIRCLEDTDGDGRYDKAAIFLKVPFPTGVLPWRNGILVTAAPNILYAEDTDGDGEADKREVLDTGFVEGNQQHRVNGLVWGLDNWIYVANGDSGGEIVSQKTGKKVNANGRDLRIRPDTGDLDAVAGQTQFGRSCDDWGNWFGCNNSNPLYQYVLDDVMQRRNPHYAAVAARVDVPEVAGNAPVIPISRLQERFNDLHTANRFTSACSAMIYRDDLFGPHFAGNAFICEPVHNLVHREVVSPKGVTFTSRRAPDEQESEFLASTDNWFRPTTVKTGPDGALWIADMYRHVIEHPQWIPDTWQKKLDLRAGHDKGRIYRVYPVDKKPRAIPRLDKLDTTGLVAALDSPSGWQRDVAQQLLIERQDKSAIPLLEKQAVSNSNPQCRLHSLCTLSGFGPVAERVLVEALADRHPGVRRHAVRLVGMLPGEISNETAVALRHRVDDSDPHVQLQLAYALGAVDVDDGPHLVGFMLVHSADDQFMKSALFSSLNPKNLDGVLATVVEQLRQNPINNLLIGDLLDFSVAFKNDQAFATLVEQTVLKGGGRPLPWKFSALARLLDSLSRRNETFAEKVKGTKGANIEKLMEGVDRLFDTARDYAANENHSPEDRIAAISLLGRDPGHADADLDLLGSFLAPQFSADVQDAAIHALGGLRQDRVADLLLDQWMRVTPVRRSQILDVLLSRDSWTRRLLEDVADGKVSRTDFDAARRQRLLEHRSADIRKQAASAFAVTVDADRQKVIDEYQPALTAKGDIERGGQLFAKTCAQCHKLAGTGHEVGPDLASLTDKSQEAMLIAILDPNRAVENKFVNYVAATKAGLVYTGILTSETGNSITLRGPEGKEEVILRGDLEDLASTSKSTMPEGLEKDLTPQDLADIIAHVRSNVPLPKRKQFAGNEPRPVKPAADGSLELKATNCEIYGSTLIFEAQYANLGYWSSLDDHAVWTIEGARAGKYAVEFEWACDASVAGNPWLLEAAKEKLAGDVESTGSWDAYRKKIVGEMALAAGAQRLTFRPAKKPQGALMDLKSIRLSPVQ